MEVKAKEAMAEFSGSILRLALQIIYTLTGQDYMIVERPEEADVLEVLPAPPLRSLHGNTARRILELSGCITQMLAEEQEACDWPGKWKLHPEDYRGFPGRPHPGDCCDGAAHWRTSEDKATQTGPVVTGEADGSSAPTVPGEADGSSAPTVPGEADKSPSPAEPMSFLATCFKEESSGASPPGNKDVGYIITCIKEESGDEISHALAPCAYASLCCKKNFTDAQKKTAHWIENHETRGNCFTCSRQKPAPIREKPFTCPTCGKRFTTNSNLLAHRRIHTGEKPFSCPECPKCFISSSDLAKHKVVHTGEKPFPCPSCEKRFTNRSNLVKHRRTHTGERPYSCHQCGKSFTSSSHLVTHRRTHTGEKPYPCPNCPKFFSNKSHLVEHQRIHTGEKPFTCPECGKCFTQKSNLNNHLRTHSHGTDVSSHRLPRNDVTA